MTTAQDAITADMEPWRAHQEQRWREIRHGFLATHECVELSRLDPAAADWLAAERIFAVQGESTPVCPVFQFDARTGMPWPEVELALAWLRRELGDWQTALWFVAPSAWTGDWRTPVDLLGVELGRVVEATRHEVTERVL